MTRVKHPVFVGVDGEGMGEGHEHAYYTLRIGDRLLRTGQPLTADECLDFISRSNPNHTHVIFAGNYDFTMILRGLPQDVVTSLLHPETRQYHTGHRTQTRPVQYGDYRLEYLPHKRLSVQYGEYKPIVIHDVFAFFQCSFVKAISQWRVASSTEIAVIEEGKARRAEANVLDDEAEQYNSLEVDILQRLMEVFNSAVRKTGLKAEPYEGPGAIATSAMNLYVAAPHRRRREPEHPPQPPPEMPYVAAYYGGRFEITAHGPIGYPVHEYDIVSAYPAAERLLPCVWHSKWIHENLGAEAKVRLGHVQWTADTSIVRSSTRLAPFPVRRIDGSVHFPLNGSGWYWSYEWDRQRLGPYYVGIDDVWSLTPDCDCQPYEWITGMYAARHQYKEQGRVGESTSLKLALNSAYGKFAQQVGVAPWQHLAYAGMITSMTRGWMYDAAMQAPDDILMLATDGIYSLTPLDLPEGSSLGQWEHTVYDDMTLVRPGIYFTPDGAKTKTRGISTSVIEANTDRILAAFHAGVDEYLDTGRTDKWTVQLPYAGLVSLKLAYSQNRPGKAGFFGTLNHSLSYDPDPKRCDVHYDRRSILRSWPNPQSIPFESVPYEPRMSDADAADDMRGSAPDRVPSGQTVLF